MMSSEESKIKPGESDSVLSNKALQSKPPKVQPMDYIDLYYIVKEIKSKLLNRYFVKWYPVSKKYYRIKFSDADIGIMLGKGIYMTKYIDAAQINSNMCVRANRLLKNRRLLDVRIEPNDRIIWFDFGTHAIVVEQFGSGNIIFLEKQKSEKNKNNEKNEMNEKNDGDTDSVSWKILDATIKRSWRTRAILSGKIYKIPESRVKSIDELFTEILNPPDKFKDQPIMIFLMKYVFGKQYYNYALNECGLSDKTPLQNLDKIKLLCLLKGVRNILDSEKYFKSVKDIPTTSVSEYFDVLYHPLLYSDPKYESLIRRLKAQEEHLESLKSEKELTKQIGDFIYNNYQQVEEILSGAKKSDAEVIKKYNIKRLNKIEIEADIKD